MQMCKRIIILFTFFIFTLQFNFANQYPDKVVFSAIRPQSDPTTQWLIALGTEAFARLGIDFEFIDLPPRRVAHYGDSGKIDGDIGRIYNYSDLHPNLVRIEEHTVVIHFSAFSLDSSIKLDKWDSLRNTDYKVEYRLGIKGSEIGVKSVVDSENQSIAKNIEEGMRKLKAGRTDIYVDTRDFVLKFMESDIYKSLNIDLYEVGIMQTISSHMHLNKKYLYLAPLVSEELRKMKSEGIFDYYKKLYNVDINW